MVDAKAYHTDGVKVDGVTYGNGVDGANDSLYAEGYKDNAFTITYSECIKNPDGTKKHRNKNLQLLRLSGKHNGNRRG